MQVTLPDGRSLYLGGGGSDAGLSAVSASGRIAKAGADAFEKGMATFGTLFSVLDKAVSALPQRPDKVQMEFAARLTGECDLWIVSGEAEAEFKVTVTWGK
jgi:hypothetical protein